MTRIEVLRLIFELFEPCSSRADSGDGGDSWAVYAVDHEELMTRIDAAIKSEVTKESPPCQ